ncbi:MAG TPA: NAD-dependent epimerase/dehydratase family protein, partial [Propionibacteriaceae bacterium]
RGTVAISSTSTEHDMRERHALRFSRESQEVAAIRVHGYEPAQWNLDGWSALFHAGFHVNHALPLRRQLATSVASTRALVEHMSRTADPRMVLLSSSSVGSKFEPLSEQTLEAVPGPYSQAKYVQEEYALLLRQAGGSVLRLRLPLVYGHRAGERHFLDDDVFASIVRTCRTIGQVPWFEGRVPLLDVETVVDHSFLSLVEQPESEDTILVDETVRPDEIAAALGLEPSCVVAPREWLERADRDPNLNPAMAKQLGPWLSAPGWDQDFATGKNVLRRLVESLSGHA